MFGFLSPSSLTWIIAALTALGVVVRPFRWPEAVWAVAGALLMIAVGALGFGSALRGVMRGLDVYLFLIGMMILSEMARREGLFDWLAAIAVGHAKGSPFRLFVLIYGVGVVVTVFLSNDATAVVLTPAVAAAARAAKVSRPLPYLLICAFIANAASFVLPISNPANLVVYGGGNMPPLGHWLSIFLLPSIVSIVLTFCLLFWTQRRTLRSETIGMPEALSLGRSGKIAGAGLVATALLLLAASGFGVDLGLPTFAAGICVMAAIMLLNRENPAHMLREISWGVLPLVAGLFVVVEALQDTGLTDALGDLLHDVAHAAPVLGGLSAGLGVGFMSNLVNNLPMGLLAGLTVQEAHVSHLISGAVLIGVDLGPNLSVTGSLATILWLAALRREGLHVGAWDFLKLGIPVMIPTLLFTLLTLLLLSV